MTSASWFAALVLVAVGALAMGVILERAHASARIAALQATLTAERAAVRQNEHAHGLAQAQLREAFAALSAQALAQNNENFVNLAQARLAQAHTVAAGDLGQRQQAIENLVLPLREVLTRVDGQLAAVEKARAGSFASLMEQVHSMRVTSEQLRTETAQLVSALKAPHVRGRWGEMQLERTVEAAGMTKHVDYLTQQTVTGADGAIRPDMVVHLTGGKTVVVDAKVPFSGYLQALEARDDATRTDRMRAHARHLREHITALSAKSYWEQFPTAPEFVVCFIPADSFLDAALREDPALMEHAFAKNVVLATPSTLVALLRTVAYSWRQESLAANAAAVQQLGRELYKRLSTYGKHVDKLGGALHGAVRAYNDSIASLERRVLVTARRMAELDVVDDDSPLPAREPITESPRFTQASEFSTTTELDNTELAAGLDDAVGAPDRYDTGDLVAPAAGGAPPRLTVPSPGYSTVVSH